MSRIEEILTQARSRLDRVDPLHAKMIVDSGGLLVDIRPQADRKAEGEIPGSVVIERIHLEWRLDPSGEHRITGFDAHTPIVVFCNEGYASSLAARDLQALDLNDATDLIGGFRAWRAAGLPVCEGGTPAVN